MSNEERIINFSGGGECPEQYDADLNGEIVAYLRLRHGYFCVECPYVNGEVVYEADPEGYGLFEDHERDQYLGESAAAILKWIDDGRQLIPIVSPVAQFKITQVDY